MKLLTLKSILKKAVLVPNRGVYIVIEKGKLKLKLDRKVVHEIEVENKLSTAIIPAQYCSSEYSLDSYLRAVFKFSVKSEELSKFIIQTIRFSLPFYQVSKLPFSFGLYLSTFSRGFIFPTLELRLTEYTYYSAVADDLDNLEYSFEKNKKQVRHPEDPGFLHFVNCVANEGDYVHSK